MEYVLWIQDHDIHGSALELRPYSIGVPAGCIGVGGLDLWIEVYGFL